jgi:hypothetical protein
MKENPHRQDLTVISLRVSPASLIGIQYLLVIARELWWTNQEWFELRWGRTIDQKLSECKGRLVHPSGKLTDYSKSGLLLQTQNKCYISLRVQIHYQKDSVVRLLRRRNLYLSLRNSNIICVKSTDRKELKAFIACRIKEDVIIHTYF